VTWLEDKAAALATLQREVQETDVQKGEEDAARAAWLAFENAAVADGPDVSEHNGDIDWTVLAGVANFAWVRTSDGNRLDLRWNGSRVAAIQQAGLTWGPYHYGRCAAPNNNERSGRVEAGMAVYFAQNAGWGAGALPLAYDIETEGGGLFNGQTAAKAAGHLIDFIKGYAFLTDGKPFVYTNPASWSLLAPHLGQGSLDLVATCPLWIAHWGATTPTVPAPWADYAFHQYTDSRSFAGIADPTVDANHFNGSRTDLANLTL